MKSANQVDVIQNELIPAAAGILPCNDELKRFLPGFGKRHPAKIHDPVAHFGRIPVLRGALIDAIDRELNDSAFVTRPGAKLHAIGSRDGRCHLKRDRVARGLSVEENTGPSTHMSIGNANELR